MKLNTYQKGIWVQSDSGIMILTNGTLCDFNFTLESRWLLPQNIYYSAVIKAHEPITINHLLQHIWSRVGRSGEDCLPTPQKISNARVYMHLPNLVSTGRGLSCCNCLFVVSNLAHISFGA